MIITKLDSLDLVDADIEATLTNLSGPIEFDSRHRQRSDGSAYVGSAVRPGAWHVLFVLPDDVTRNALIAALDGDRSVQRRLEALRGVVAVEAHASIRRLTLPTLGLSAEVDFEPTEPTWRAMTAQTTSDTLTANDTITAAVGGNTRVAPQIRIQPTVQRATETAVVGWKRRRRYRITNLSDETWYRLPILISLGDTTGIVSAGRALANGDDVRVWLAGREVARTLKGWNGATSGVWLITPKVAPAESLDVDVVWHNAEAVTPPVLAYPDAPPFDMAVSTNALWRYQVTAGNGAWYLASALIPGIIDQDVPGAWRSLMTLPNPDNVDDVAQYPYSGAAGSYYAGFNAVRGVAGGLSLANEGLADGISLHHPCGIVSISTVISFRNDAVIPAWVGLGGVNPAVALGKLVILVRGTGAQGWAILYQNATEITATPVTISRATYTPAAPVKHLAFAVWPYNEIEVFEGTTVGHQIHCYWSDYSDVVIDDTKIDIDLIQAETEIYELATVLAVDPADGTTIANELRLGISGSTDAFDVPRLAVELDQVVILDGETRTAAVWDSALSAKVETVPNYAVRAVRIRDVLGATAEFPTSDWLPIRPTPAGVDVDVSEAEMGELAVDVDIYPEWVP